MGCWNGTCAITGLPVLSGNPIVIVPILENDCYDSGICGDVYSNARFAMVGMPIRGQYNDYGGIENVGLAPNLEDGLLKNINENKAKFNYKDIEDENHEFKCVEDWVNDGLERGCSYKKESLARAKQEFPLGFMMILEVVYDKFIKTKSLKSYKKIKEEEFSLIRDSYEVNNQFTTPLQKILYGDNLRMHTRILDEVGQLRRVFELARIRIMPPSGAGSQCNEMELHKQILSLATRINNTRIKYYNEY